MSTTYIADGLYAWTVTLANGEVRQTAAKSVVTAVGHLPVIKAERGAAITQALPAPVVTPPLVPAGAAVGAGAFTLQVNGTGFQAHDTILWNGVPKATTFVSPTQLTAALTMAGTSIGPIPVAVQNVFGEVSNGQSFVATA